MRNILAFDALDRNFQNNPYPIYEKIHSSNAILMDPNLNAYFFGHYEDVSRILCSPSFTTAPLADRAEPVMGDRVLAQMEGQEHHSKRRSVLSGLSGKLFRERYAAMVEQVTGQLLAEHMRLGKIDLINDFGKPYSVLVTLKVLGIPTDRYKDIAVWHAGVAAFITNLKMTSEQRAYSLSCSHQLIEYLTPIVNEQKTQNDGSLISILCNAESDGQKMTTSEVVALILNVILAAVEPADKTLAYLFHHLLTSPGQLDRVRGDRQLLSAALGETLRLTSPVQLIPRQTREDVSVAGVHLPEGTLVFCMVGAANRDPSIFQDPSVFILDRKRGAKTGPEHVKAANHLAFGAGKHVCVGAAFSRLQIELTANLLLDRLEELRLAPGFSLQEEGLYTRGPSALNLQFRPCHETDARSTATPRVSA